MQVKRKEFCKRQECRRGYYLDVRECRPTTNLGPSRATSTSNGTGVRLCPVGIADTLIREPRSMVGGLSNETAGASGTVAACRPITFALSFTGISIFSPTRGVTPPPKFRSARQYPKRVEELSKHFHLLSRRHTVIRCQPNRYRGVIHYY